MEILIYTKRNIVFLMLSLLCIDCNKALPPEYSNRHDPNSSIFQGNKPSLLHLTMLSDNAMKLDWTNNSAYASEFIVERSINSDNNFVKIGQVESNVSSFVDSNFSINDCFSYRLRMNNNKTNLPIIDTFEICSEKIELAESVKDYRVSPNKKYILLAGENIVRVIDESSGGELFRTEGKYTVGGALCDDYVATFHETFSSTISLYLKYFKIWKISDGVLMDSIFFNDWPDYFEFSHSGNILLWSYGRLYICDLTMHHLVTEKYFRGGESLSYFEFSKDDRYVIALNWLNEVLLIDTHSWQVVYTVPTNNLNYYTYPHFLSNDVFYYFDGSNSIIFYNFKENRAIKSITLSAAHWWRANVCIMINENPPLLFTPNGTTIVFWVMKDLNLGEKYKTIDLGQEIPIKTNFSISTNSFLVLTNSEKLFRWKYY